MQSKVEMYKGTMDDQNNDRIALLKEKDQLWKDHIQLKKFVPEYDQMEQLETLQQALDHRELTMKNLELSNEDLKKQLDAKKRQLLKMKDT